MYVHDGDCMYGSGTPFGQLPILELEGGVMLCQSLAIARYLARKFGKQVHITDK